MNTVEQKNYDTYILIVGTGFSGLGMAISLKNSGINDFRILERSGDVGGTWRDNHYPGAACDIESHLYSFSFEGKPDWSRKYPSQPEIKRYISDTAEKYDINRHIDFQTTVLEAAYDEQREGWLVKTNKGVVTCKFLIFGTGALSEPSVPSIEGFDTFTGDVFHSAQWDHSIDLNNKRVSVIGTGASAIQFVPEVADVVEHLNVFQRTPPWVLPRPDRKFTSFEKFLFKYVWPVRQIYRNYIFWNNEFQGIGIFRPDLMEGTQKKALEHIHAQISDPELQKKVTPDYIIGCKRILLSNKWYPTFNKHNVSLVTSDIESIGNNFVRTCDGLEHPSDVIIFGTGFKVTDYLQNIKITGRDNIELAEAWKDGGEAYVGVSIKSFPNLFLITGPNTGLGHNSMVYMIETNINHITEAIKFAKRKRLSMVEVKAEIQEQYNTQIQNNMKNTVWKSGCKSWYQTPSGKIPTLWPGYCFQFGKRARNFNKEDYLFQAWV